MDLEQRLREFLAFAKSSGCRRLCIAYSGGVDSHVLLFLINKLNRKEDVIAVDAIYVNHNLHADSQKWGEHCKKVCKLQEIPFQQLDVDAAPERGESPEEKAREARYSAFATELNPGDWLLTAQHKEDQAETLLLQLLRGSGVYGLSAMPASRALGKGEHHRPLLNASKGQIEQCAKQQQLKWIEDPSNQQQTVPRNYLRKTVIPAMKDFWPETNTMLGRSAGWLAEAAELLTEVAREDFIQCSGDFQSMNIMMLHQLSFSRQKNLLRYWFHQMGLQRPGNDKLILIFEQIVNARGDANPQLDWQGITLKRYKNNLYLLPVWPEPTPHWQQRWDGDPVSLPADCGLLSASEQMGKGLNKSICKQGLSLQLRQGGERCHPEGRGHSQSLKKLFQEYSVPPWLRSRWPLLYCDQQLVAVAGLFVCKGFEAKAKEAGLVFSVEFNTRL